MSDKGKGKRDHSLSDSSKVASRVQRKALWESRIFELDLPQDIQNHITTMKCRLWDELESQKLKEEAKKVQEWILDPGHTLGRMSLNEKSIALFWVMKNLLDRAEWDHQSPDLDNSSHESW